MTAILQENDTAIDGTLYMALELSNKKWKLGFSDGGRYRIKTIDAGNWTGLLDEINQAREKFKLSFGCRIASCYEAGRDGFWIDRALKEAGIENQVIDSSSIEVSRRSKRVKTDRVDVKALLSLLMRYHHGEKAALRSIRVPEISAEDQRRINRERERLIKERGAHSARIKSLFKLHGINLERMSEFPALIQTAKGAVTGYDLPVDLKIELQREYQRYLLVDQQIKAIEKEQIERVAEGDELALQKINHLRRLKGVGWQSSWILIMEFFNWRDFKNAKQLGSCAGLTPTPYDSGDSTREQGISKAGNKRVRKLMIELSWLWLRYQPDNALSCWFEARFGKGGQRMRRIGIVALARKLLIALWRYLEQGVLPEGAILKAI